MENESFPEARRSALDRLTAVDDLLLRGPDGGRASQRTADRVFALHADISQAASAEELKAADARLSALEKATGRLRSRRRIFNAGVRMGGRLVV